MTQRYDIVKFETIKPQGGEEKHLRYKIGSANTLDNGSVQCYLPEGVAITGKFTLSPRKPKEANGA